MNLYIFNIKCRGSVFGIGTYIRELTAALKGSELKICIINLYSDKPQIQIEEIDGIKHWYFPKPVQERHTIDDSKRWELYHHNVVNLLQLHIEDTKDLIFHLNYNQRSNLAAELKNAFDCKIVTVVHFTDWSLEIFDNPERLRNILKEENPDSMEKDLKQSIEAEKSYYATADRILCVSHYLKEILCGEYGVDAKKIAVVPNGLQDYSIDNGQLTKSALRKKWHLMHGEKIILFAGRIDEVKGGGFLIRAFREVLEKFPRCRLILAGSGNYKIYLQEAKYLSTKISFTGLLEQHELQELYRIADVGAVPSLFEPFGYVAVEMMMYGLPIVATATSGLNEVIDDRCGLKVPLEKQTDSVKIDTSLLAQKMVYLLQHSTEAKKMGQNGRKKYLKEYSSEVFRENMLQLYRTELKNEDGKTETVSQGNIDVSVIVPIFNMGSYLTHCIESLLQQDGIRLEIILVNDGSTDCSGAIADQFALQDSRIRVVHQENRGASAARNAGLKLAQGEYIAFVDSDDWIKKDTLRDLYSEATEHQADVLIGNIWTCNQHGKINKIWKKNNRDILNMPLSGKDSFIYLVRTYNYLPMPFKYIYRREYLNKIKVRFEEGIMHEDELWCPIVLSQAEKVVFSGIAHYYYRIQKNSVMRTTNVHRRLNSLFRVTDLLFNFTDQYVFSGKDGELKNWLYANIYRLYNRAFTLLPQIKDSSFVLPKHQLYRCRQDGWAMMPEPLQICMKHLQNAEISLKHYSEGKIGN